MNCDRSRLSLSNLRHPTQNARRPIATAWAIELPGNTDPDSASNFPARRARLGLWTSVPWLFQGISYLWFISKGAIA
jgi:hypothetical protein